MLTQGSTQAMDRHRPKVAIAMPGGFDFGGIGRLMMYATTAWQRAGAPIDWRLVDARGNGRLVWLPLMTARAVVGLIVRRPDLLHLNVANRGSTLRKLVLSRVAAILRIPTIVHLHFGDYATDFARRGPLVQREIKAMFQRARQVIVLGRNDRRTLETLLGVSPDRLVILGNAVPDPGPPPDRTARSGPVQLVFVGRFDDPLKGLAELLEALAGSRLAAFDWRLVVAGSGKLEPFRGLLRNSTLNGRCTFTGWLPQAEIYALCRAADIFVLPSHSEGQAMSLLEAMAHGLAIVTTPVGAHLEAVGDDKEALIVSPRNVAQLGDALARLLADPGLRRRLGAAARLKYCCRFNAEQYSSTLLQLITRALSDPPVVAY